MKADAESLERAIAPAKSDPTTPFTIIENALGSDYHWISYGCIRKYQQHRDKHQGLIAYLVGLDEQRLAQWWRNFEDVRQASAKSRKYSICLGVFAPGQRPRREVS